ncbi:hypothetical protein EN817_20800 [Mesorhizobium sp. M3A.F.Ca.ET.174.01.1.1]|uniref:hypothetical protein n=1 Tax=unclassified Mesorhizobium TaxID=325217 RepID=UPI0010938C2F|nr:MULTISPECIES: hypothetical protein [unclassified Mesorhizobium]TGS85774.1 hypothetical protein EN818_17540 [Mesorhizobium sp. M3A.F.Ca.ET.175.01.1.1]TGT23916.1 hypothetical protein EN817_20800 [Mesorhizobium sp. M3A.F.Ca.ET.174.01.1.1]
MTNKLLEGATRRTLLTAIVGAAAVMFIDPLQASAADTSGIHGFFNDDRNQFVDVWLNTSGALTVKVSNGRPWRPMWVVMHVAFMLGGQVVGRKDYHVFCPSPVPGGHGNERWFKYANPGFGGVTEISVTTNKEAPWGHPSGEWEVDISGSSTF